MKDFILNQGNEGVWYGIFPQLAKHCIKHGISTRLNGFSSTPFESLNLGLHTGDITDRVIGNRQKFCKGVGINFSKVVTCQQIHGDQIYVVTKEDTGRGIVDYNDAISDCDALITNETDVPLMLFFADCVPILIADIKNRAIGISHAGWKGTTLKIAQKTVMAMSRHFNTRPENCLVAIGPSIGPCCYEVDEKVVDVVKERFIDWKQLIRVSVAKRWYLDLWKANVSQLTDINVQPENIFISNVCTACNNRLFFSYRAERGLTGRICAFISL